MTMDHQEGCRRRCDRQRRHDSTRPGRRQVARIRRVAAGAPGALGSRIAVAHAVRGERHGRPTEPSSRSAAAAAAAIAAAIAADLVRLGVRGGGVLLVHASLSSMGWVEGGPETVIRGLVRALGPGGILALPALSFDYVGARNPRYDVRLTPSCVGAIPEHLRLRPGTRRSAHPTHSVCAVGPVAEALLGEHHRDQTPCGPRSPFRRVRDLGGQILFLGCGLRPNTSMHGVEEVVEAPHLFGETITYRITLEDGATLDAAYPRHAFRGWLQRYDRLGGLLEKGSELRIGSVLQATAHLVEARALWERAEAVMRRDPYYFVERALGPGRRLTPRPRRAHPSSPPTPAA